MFRISRSDKTIKEILKTLVIVIDTREQKNEHITEYFIQKDIKFELKKLDQGDYSCYIPKNEEYGIQNDIFINTFVERKNGIGEITGNLQKNSQQAFENELIRSQGKKFVLFVEEPDFDEKLASGDYRSSYDPKALKGRLESFKMKYGFEIVPMSKRMIAHNIYHRFYYQVRHLLKGGMI
ncbi:ERCC4 domain-containing protein [Bacillus toyonensis]|uniref:ERCC4 domain-containing protein n=1 Tax=Bacillus toyonensis TaxID=155322 RepID=UPI0005344958|nr:ERCC4 domain-containing protein [Bacillus toyonensis]